MNRCFLEQTCLIMISNSAGLHFNLNLTLGRVVETGTTFHYVRFGQSMQIGHVKFLSNDAGLHLITFTDAASGFAEVEI